METPRDASGSDDDSDRSDTDIKTLDDGPLSLHLHGLETTAEENELSTREQEQHELAYLRLENALLKKKVKTLERVARGDKRAAKLVVDESDMEQISVLLQKAADAKAEAMDYVANTSRDKLEQDVKVLQSILKKAKAERHAFKKKIRAAEESLELERHKIEKEEIRFQVDREIFAKILQDDRDAYKYEVNLLVQKMTEIQKEKHDLFTWAKEQNERHLHEIRKLTRALGRTKKTVDEHVRTSEAVLDDVQRFRSQAVVPDAAPCRPATSTSSGVYPVVDASA